MSIPTQFPQLAVAIRPSALQALVLQAGQTLQAVIISTAANGTTQVQIGQQTLNVSLPTPMPDGTVLNLQAQGSGSQQKLVLLPQSPSQAPQGTLAPPPQANAAQPAQPMPTLASAPSPVPLSPPVVLPTRPGAVQPLGLQPGQAVEARVVGPAPNGATQIQIGRQTLEVTLPRAIPAGTALPLQVQGSGAQQQLVLQPMPVPMPAPGPQAGPLPQPASTAPMPTANAPAPPAQTQAPAPQAPPWTPTPSAPQSGPVSAQTPAQPPPATPPPPSPPQAALTQMVQQAVQRQDSVANLTTVLSAVIGKVTLPQPVQQAAQQVLAASLPLTGPAFNGAALQKAVATSGIFQEALLAQGAPQAGQGDLKTALLVLRNTLVSWVGPAGAVTVPPGPLPPPVRGAPPRARHGAKDALDIPSTPLEAGKVMLERTEGSLARLRLHQHASLPEQSAPGAQADWSLDLPVVVGTYQTVMQMQIHRDEAGVEQAPTERGWQIRFAMDLPALGEVGAQVGLRGGTTSVRLWASDPATADKFAQGLPELALSLQAAGLRPGMIAIRPDEPAAAPTTAGHFVDSVI